MVKDLYSFLMCYYFGNHNSYELYLQKDLINRGYYKPRFYIWR